MFLFQCVNYNIFIEDMVVNYAPNQTIFDTSNLFVMGRDRVINGTVLLKEDLDERFKVKMELFMDPSGTGNFKRSIYGVPYMKFCKYLKEFGALGEATLRYGENTNFNLRDVNCPIKKDTYYFIDINIVPEGWPAQVPRGPIKFVATLKMEDQLVGNLVLLLRCDDKLD